MNDFKFAIRQLLKNPGFTTVAVLTLAIGVGANTAIFSVVNGVLLRPLPFPESQRLARLSEAGRDWTGGPISYPNFADWKAQQTSFESIGLYRDASYNLTGDGEPLRVTAGEVAADVLSALRVQPMLGRVFTTNEDKPGGPRVALLSYALWQSRFGGDPGIIDKTISLNGRAYTVLGVMPRGFEFPERASLWTPVELGFNDALRQTRGERPGHKAIGRLKPNATLEQAQSELSAVAARLAQQFPGSNKNRTVGIEPLLDSQVGKVRRGLWILLGAVALVLLIACANVANLLLARAAARQKEMAVRTALGAGRWRIVRQLLTESILLALTGGTAGLLFAHWSLGIIVALGESSLPRANEIQLDGVVLLFSAAVALATGILFGLAPAIQASRPNLHDTLKDTSRGTTGGRARLRHGLIVAEVGLTLVLLTGAGLLLKSFYNLLQVNPGFAHEQVLTFRLSLPSQRYSAPDVRSAFYENLLSRIRALPGVQTAGIASRIPLNKNSWQTSFRIEGRPEPLPGEWPSMEAHTVGPDYFRTMGIAVLRGRTFTEQDNRDHIRGTDREQSGNAALNVIVIDEEFARRHFPNEDPIGRQVRLPWGPKNPVLTVIGVVKRVREERLSEWDGQVQAYFSFLQRPDGGMAVVVKAALPPETLIATVRQQVLALDSELPLYEVRTMSALRAENIAPERLNLALLGTFAAVALVLAVIGLYGVLAYAVTQRRREIGIRVALGAQQRDVIGLFIGQGMKLVMIGATLGVFGAFAATRILANLLFEVQPADPLTFAGVSALLAIVALLACWFPAHRAARINPMEALRYE
jgi:putative ABC transport system permease protein